MKLVSISFKAIPRMPGMRAGDLATITCDKPNDGLKGWRLALRGQQAFFISPAGWEVDRSVLKPLRADGPVSVFEVPRSEIVLQWAGAHDEVEAILKSGKFDSEPFGGTPPVIPDKPLLEQIPAHQRGD